MTNMLPLYILVGGTATYVANFFKVVLSYSFQDPNDIASIHRLCRIAEKVVMIYFEEIYTRGNVDTRKDNHVKRDSLS
jgi:hypothetical protein